LLEKILEFNPDIKSTVFDTASTIERAKQQPANNIRADSFSYVSGDFFTSVPYGYDAYILSGVIHDWDDSRAIKILSNCRRAMAEKGRVLIVDVVVPDTDATSFGKFLDLNMLAMTGGRERTKAEFRTLLDAADHRLTRIIPTLAPQSIIEAVPKAYRPTNHTRMTEWVVG
jgi:hypothetical protein